MNLIDLDVFLRQTAPFRFVDHASYSDEDGLIRSSCRYVGDEAFFAGHFPDEPIVPGVILIESMAQSCRAWLNWRLGRKAGGFIASVERAKLIKPVRPGDVVEMTAKALNVLEEHPTSSRFCRFSCLATCAGEEVAKVSVTLYQSI